MLSIEGLSRRFGAKTAVDNVSLTIESGRFVGVIGRSGAGKSTLLRMINRLEQPSSGAIRFNDIDVTRLSDAALAATLDDWAPPLIGGLTRREHFAKMDLRSALRSNLDYAQGMILERETPTHFKVPSGSAIAIDYLDGEIPTLSVRLQELFGLHETPAVAGGRLPLLLKLLSPAGRPVQITRDLVSFWQRGYHEVKKDLKGRYPKHYWPDDPYTAEATRRARPR